MIGNIARIVLAITFGMAGLQKTLRWRTSVSGVVNYDLVPRRMAALIGYLLPLVELSLAILLLFGWWPGAAAGGAILLAAMFAAAVGTNLARDRRIPCGCWGGHEDISVQSLIRLSALAVAGVAYGQSTGWGLVPAGKLSVDLLVTGSVVTGLLIVADRVLVEAMPRRIRQDTQIDTAVPELVGTHGGAG